MRNKNRRYKWFSIEKVNVHKGHIGAFFCVEDEQVYLMISLWKWDIYFGKLIDWNGFYQGL